MLRELWIAQLKKYEEEYQKFMLIDNFPKYEIETKEASIKTADSQGFDSIAAAFYQPQTQKHTLKVSTNLLLTKHVMFHEFTHILDSELYVNGDKMRYAGLSGFTEYHASQIELMKLLNAKNINDKIEFSMNEVVDTISGKKTVFQYIHDKQNHAIELFERKDFPANLETLKSAIGILYNYWGIRSICEMYSTDYVENINNDAFLKIIPTQHFCLINNLMHRWLDKTSIDASIPLYINIIFPLIQQFGLA